MRKAVPSPLPPLGAHVSVAGGLANAFGRAADLGCTAIQIFVKNANQWLGKEMADADVLAFRDAHTGSVISASGSLVAHGSYLINLAATDRTILKKSRAALADELTRCGRLGVAGLVLHPGAHLGAGEKAGIKRVAASLDAVLKSLPDAPTRVLLENTAGQGSCLGWRLEELAAIRDQVKEPHRIGFCLDTCHAFAAGYAIHEPAGFDDFWAEVDERLGLDTVACVHLNDSLRPFASRRDRHAHIGEGEIGLGCFQRLLTEKRLRKIPMVLETEPGDEMAGHRRDLEVLRGLVSSPSGRSSGSRRSSGSSSWAKAFP
jgi:deoxyribonuclease-4